MLHAVPSRLGRSVSRKKIYLRVTKKKNSTIKILNGRRTFFCQNKAPQ